MAPKRSAPSRRIRSTIRGRWLVLAGSILCGCGANAPHPAPEPLAVDVGDSKTAIGEVLDDWHAAAAAADEARYFAHLTEDAVFLGTDATERWNKAAFRQYAHPHFAKGKAWSFSAVRRAITVSADGRLAWFDEDLDTPNLGPARGSGVLRKENGVWRIAHYNLAITVPNDQFDAVKRALGTGQPATSTVPVSGHVVVTGDTVKMKVPAARMKSHFCQDTAVVHDALRVGKEEASLGGRPLADVLVRLPLGAVEGEFAAEPVHIAQRNCQYHPRMVAMLAGQQFVISNDDPTMHNVNAHRGQKQLFNSGQPPGADPIETSFEETGLHRLTDAIHPWKRAFVWVSDHPFFSVTDAAGRFHISGLADGTHTVEAWHAQLGLKTARLVVESGRAHRLVIRYSGDEPAPPENPNELDGLF
jgi:ketosteroid isomerase-like protein/plastocyanin